MCRTAFAESYRDTFACVGIRLQDSDGCSEAEFARSERRLGGRLPDSVAAFFRLAGREQHINQAHHRLLTPDRWIASGRHVVFMEECLQVVEWAVPVNTQPTSDAPVFQGVGGQDGVQPWAVKHLSCFTFLNVMTIWQSAFGGGAVHTARGHLDSGERCVLDVSGWQAVGEVGGIRAYKRPGQALCIAHWRHPARTRQPPGWRAFVAAASADDLDRIKTAIPAEWEERR